MANEFEMYDYVSTKTPDYNYTLDMQPHDTLVEDGSKKVKVKEYDDDSETRIIRSSQSVFFVDLTFSYLSESDAGILFDLYHDSAKACATARSFKWLNHAEPSARRHTYVVRFASPLPRTIRPAQSYAYGTLKLKVLGRILDA